jgi:hypothetical protein
LEEMRTAMKNVRISGTGAVQIRKAGGLNLKRPEMG